MRAGLVVLTILAAAITLASVAAAEPAATKQRVAITVRFHEKAFALVPLQKGALEADSGSFTDDAPNAPCRDVIRDGQKVGLCSIGWTFSGKRGSLTVRAQQGWVDPGSGGCGVAVGTWKVVRGTGVYAGIAGGGRSAYDAHCQKWYARHEGFLVTR